jgi:hypothetical protein
MSVGFQGTRWDSSFRVEGIEKVVGNLNAAVRQLYFLTSKGMIAGGELILDEAQKRTPVETGWLKEDAQTSNEGDPADPAEFKVAIAYMEFYAVYVHERAAAHVGAPFVDWKFLERAINDNYQRIMWTIFLEARPPW